MEVRSYKLDAESYANLIEKERKANSTWNKLKRNKTAMAGLVIASLLVFMAVFAPFITRYDPNLIDIKKAYLKPGTEGHIFGTDEYGRDLFTRIVYGSRISIIVAVGSTIVGAVIGLLLGLIAGMEGGAVDSVIMRIMDGMFAFPFILLAILLVTILGSGVPNVILAIGISTVPSYARLVRGQVHIVKKREYCDAMRVLGASKWRLMFVHILPNTLSCVIVQATLSIAGSIISEASLSFLGLGILPPTSSWGTILSGGRACLRTAPHIATIAGLTIFVTVLGFNLLGDGIRDVLDPKMKR